MRLAESKRSEPIVVNGAPTLSVSEGTGEITLNFGLIYQIQTPDLSYSLWYDRAQEFVDMDPEVDEITIQVDPFNLDVQDLTEKYDCFYKRGAFASTNVLPFLDIAPLAAADIDFVPTDFVGGVLSQVGGENQMKGYPITIEPSVLFYDSERFAQAGILLPKNGWTINAFLDALTTLGSDEPALENLSGADAYTLLLVAAFGGLPIEFSAEPLIVDFTNPENVDAIRQVLDLARSGYINYQEIGFNFPMIWSHVNRQPPIYGDRLWPLQVEILPVDPNNNPYRLTTYPANERFGVASFAVNAAYISATTPNPEACYRWIKTISRDALLFDGMPARYSVINDPLTTTVVDETLLSFYHQFAQLIANPTTVIVPDNPSFDERVVIHFLNRAMSNYVRSGGDLEADLEIEQTNAMTYLTCVEQINERYPGGLTDYSLAATIYGERVHCATQLAPELEPLLPRMK